MNITLTLSFCEMGYWNAIATWSLAAEDGKSENDYRCLIVIRTHVQVPIIIIRRSTMNASVMWTEQK